MADFTLRNEQKFPRGTSVGIYAAAAFRSGAVPAGSVITSGTIDSGGSYTFTGLDPDEHFVAYALVGSQHRYVKFSTSRPRTNVLEVVGDIEDGVAPVYEEASGSWLSTPVVRNTDAVANPLPPGSRKVREGIGVGPAHNATAMGSPPTVSLITTSEATSAGLTQTVATNNPAFVHDTEVVYNSGGYVRARPQLQADGTTRAGGWGAGWSRAFTLDGDKVAMSLTQSGTMRFRVWVDGVPATADLVLLSSLSGYTGSGAKRLYIEFAAKARRTIVIELEDSSAIPEWYSAVIRPSDTISPPLTPSAWIGCIGDSYVAGTTTDAVGTSLYSYSFMKQLYRKLGHWRVSTKDAVPGTGLIKTNGSSAGTYQSRAADLTANAFDLIDISLSINDRPYVGLNQIGPALTTLIDTIRAVRPEQRIIVRGPHFVATPTTEAFQIRDEGRVAALAAGVPFIDTIPGSISDLTRLYFFGTGRQNSAAGNGNADYYRGTDGTGAGAGHPNKAGHDHLAAVYAPLTIAELPDLAEAI